jgi:hypothetical protein
VRTRRTSHQRFQQKLTRSSFVTDDLNSDRSLVVSISAAKPRTFLEAVSEQGIVRDRSKDLAQWQQEISASTSALDFPTLAAAAIKNGLPPSLFRSLCDTLLDNRWIADAIASDIPNLDRDGPDAN